MSVKIPTIHHFSTPFPFLLKEKMCEYNIPLQIFSLEGGTLEFLGRFSTSVFFGGPVSFTDLQLVNI